MKAAHLLGILPVLLFLTAVCSTTGTDEPTVRIGIAGRPGQWHRLDTALERMGEPFTALDSVSLSGLRRLDLLVLPRAAYADDIAGCAGRNSELMSWVSDGGVLLLFGVSDRNYRAELLPHEVRFASEDPSGWGNVDFSEEIADTTHPLFNRPHRLRYLAGLEEPSRVVFTAPQWRILLAKNPEHPTFDHELDNPPNDVGSIFETSLGEGHVLVCQPIIDQYHAGNASIVPHPLEQGVLLFENLIEYMKQKASEENLPLAHARAVPDRCAPGTEITFSAGFRGGQAVRSCSWDFGDGASGEGATASHSFGDPGVYWITSTVRGRDGGVDRAACRVEVGPAREMRWADYIVDAFMHRYYPAPGRVGPNYRTALVLSGMLDVYERTRDPELLDYLRGFFEERLISRWEDRPFRGEKNTGVNFVDLYSLMSPAWRIFRATGDSTYARMALEVWQQSLDIDHSLPKGLLWSPHDWGGRRAIVDFTYFKCLLRAEAWRATGDTALLDEAATQMLRFTDYFQDPADSLFFMAIDMDHEAYFTSPDRPSGLNDSKWNRANGWVAMAFTELLRVLPADHRDRDRIERVVRRFFGGLVEAQDPETGLWALVVDRRDYPGMWLETTGTSMYVYSMATLVDLGILPREPFLDCARRGYNGLQRMIGLGHWDYPYLSNACQGTAPRLDLDRWIQAHRHDNDLHVLGPFLMAEEALWKVSPPEVAVIGNLKSPECRAGGVLHFNGLSFIQLPDLYTSGNLGAYRAVVIDRGALAENTANVRAYADKIRSYAENGGRVMVLGMPDESSFEEVFPELYRAQMFLPGKSVVETDRGNGKMILCRDYPEPSGKEWREEMLRFGFISDLLR